MFCINLFKNNSTIIVPIALNNKCIIAALLAFFPAPTDESKAVVVVPILPLIKEELLD